MDRERERGREGWCEGREKERKEGRRHGSERWIDLRSLLIDVEKHYAFPKNMQFTFFEDVQEVRLLYGLNIVSLSTSLVNKYPVGASCLFH